MNPYIWREIHPVGQGALYSESFHMNNDWSPDFVALYDCGSFNKTRLFMEIKGLPQKIDCLFVSHFHFDHINGIERLVEMKQVDQIYVPLLTPSQFIISLLYNTFEHIADKPSVKFMMQCLDSFRFNDSIRTDYGRIIPVSKRFQRNVEIGGQCLWHYDVDVEYSESESEALPRFLSNLASMLDMDKDELIAAIEEFQTAEWYKSLLDKMCSENVVKDVRRLYRQCFSSDGNAVSLIAYSYRDKPSTECDKFDCVYTGDAKLSDNMVQVISKWAPQYIQVPHHGSNYNHIPQLYYPRQVAFISVGEKNKYHHPGLEVINYLADNCVKIHCVTENIVTRLKVSANLACVGTRPRFVSGSVDY